MILVHKDEQGIFEYEVFGDAQTQIYLFQGYGGTVQTWSRQFIESLSQNFQVITFNYPGVGKSSSPKDVTSFDDYCDFFHSLFLRLNNGKKFVLLGFSMGIYVVRNMLLNNKNLFPEKIVFCSGSFGGKYRIHSSSEIMQQLKTAGNDNLHLLFSKEKLVSAEDYINLLMHPTEEKSSKELLDFQGNLIFKFFREHCEDEEKNKINIDSLIVHGSNDLIFPKENAISLSKFCSKNHELYFTQGGHAHLFEYAEDIINKIREFCL